MSNAIKMAKRSLRREVQNKLSQVPREDIAKQSQTIHSKLFQLKQFAQAERVGLYLSMPNEVDTVAILQKCLDDGKLCFVPRFDVHTRHMDFVQCFSMDDYRSMPIEPKYQIKQPPMSDTTRPLALSTGGLDLLLVPAVAFTLSGHRLGHGKGYFDTWLARYRQADKVVYPFTVGLALTQQIVEQVPLDQWDVTIDRVISP